MKRYLFMLLIPLGLLSGCMSNFTAVESKAFTVGYYHDDVHKVGIWRDYSGSIAILPDKDYFNVGEPIGQ